MLHQRLRLVALVWRVSIDRDQQGVKASQSAELLKSRWGLRWGLRAVAVAQHTEAEGLVVLPARGGVQEMLAKLLSLLEADSRKSSLVAMLGVQRSVRPVPRGKQQQMKQERMRRQQKLLHSKRQRRGRWKREPC